ncbi:uncharacterized protein LOC143040046 [Oratosquilla oratoria]|uniref:uncharacterized protein LOC143040046 n=1 Tax=Oratosquilla oratoria TaxID=337810 RepID=UPI003F757AF5
MKPDYQANKFNNYSKEPREVLHTSNPTNVVTTYILVAAVGYEPTPPKRLVSRIIISFDVVCTCTHAYRVSVNSEDTLQRPSIVTDLPRDSPLSLSDQRTQLFQPTPLTE